MLKSEYEAIATEIVMQMGGFNKLRAMVGASFSVIAEGLGGAKISFKGSRQMNLVEIRVNGMDLYDVEFKQVTIKNNKSVKAISGIYCDQLKELFENTTGLYLSLW